jgi:hypothetical protein
LADYQRRTANSLALAKIRAAIPALEAWRADHNTYEGATLARLRKYDYGIGNVEVVYASRNDYCLESRVGGAVVSKRGPVDAATYAPCNR